MDKLLLLLGWCAVLLALLRLVMFLYGGRAAGEQARRVKRCRKNRASAAFLKKTGRRPGPHAPRGEKQRLLEALFGQRGSAREACKKSGTV